MKQVRALMALIFSSSPLGINTRSLLATALLVPVVLGLLIFYGESAAWYDGNFARSLYIISVVILLSVVVVYNAQRLFQAETSHSILQSDFRQVQQQLQVLVENSPTAIFIMDVNGNYRLVNSHFEELVGKPRSEILGKKAAALFKDDLLKSVLETDEKVARTKAVVSTEMRAELNDQARTYLNIKFPLLDGEGNVQSIGGIWTDITEQKRLSDLMARKNEDLERSNKELEQFAYVASHDLQEPLRMVSSYMQLLEGRYKDKLDKDAQEFIGYAVDGAVRMQRLIQDLLAFSRVGTRGKDPEVTDTNSALEEALGNLKLRIEENKAKIEVGSLPPVMADRQQLVQVFQNLIGNAIKFKDKKDPIIRISTKPVANGFAEFSIADNGIGFDAKHADRIFVIFQRLNSREQYEGTGIGLAICKKIVERHGGRIWVESQVDKGSTFHFTFPLVSGEAAIAVQAARPGEVKLEVESVEERAGRLI